MRNLALILLFFFTQHLYAAVKPIPPIIKKLLQTEKSVQIFHSGNIRWLDIPDLPESYNDHPQHLLKTNEGIFLTVPGTGRVYRAEFTEDKMNFKRIDSTVFFGYNFNSYSFNIRNTIYNFGGLGFWHVNGNLRIYLPEQHEWNAIKTNYSVHKEFTPTYFFFAVDTALQELYVNGSIMHPEYVKNDILDSNRIRKLFRLNIKRGDWTELGTLNISLVHPIFANTSWGFFTENQIMDVNSNKIYTHPYYLEISNIATNTKFYKDFTFISFCIDSTIYFGNNTDRIDSFIIHRSLISDTGKPVFTPLKASNSIFQIYYLMALIPLIGSAFYFFKKKTSKSPTTIKNEPILKIDEKINSHQPLKSGSIIDLLNSQQIDFLRFLYNHSEDERTTTIDEINRILGTQQKTIEIQKKMRSDMINGINDRISLSLKIKTVIIDKKRSEFDKRSFEYFINPIHMNLVKDILETG